MELRVFQYTLRTLIPGLFALSLPFWGASMAKATGAEPDLDCGQQVVVEELVCGEIDPFIIGDACFARVRQNGVVYGLLASNELVERLGYERLENLRGRHIGLGNAVLTPVEDEATADLLDEARPSDDQRHYYWWDGNWTEE